LVREELRQAARKRRDEVRPTGVDALNEAERVLLRAAASSPESRVCLSVFQALHDQPQSFEGLSVAPILSVLRDRGPLEPLSAVSDPAHRALLAQALLRESGEVELREVEAALESLKYRHLEALQRRVRADIAEAERRGDLAQLAVFMAEKLKVDRQMREADR
jgi:DNA primase